MRILGSVTASGETVCGGFVCWFIAAAPPKSEERASRKTISERKSPAQMIALEVRGPSQYISSVQGRWICDIGLPFGE